MNLPSQNGRSRSLLASRIRALRQSRKWSQEVLAKLSGLHRSYVGSVERAERNISLDNIEKLADALGVQVAELLSRPTTLSASPETEALQDKFISQ